MRSLKTSMAKMIRYFSPDFEGYIGVGWRPFPFPIVEIEEESGRKTDAEKEKEGENARYRAHVRISRKRLKIPDRHVFAAYKSTTFQRSRCSALVVKARTCVTIDGFSPTTN